MRSKTTLTLATAAAILVAAGAAQAGTLENLERERALTIQTLLSPSLTVSERQQKIAASKHRLVDLERMVLRDKSLVLAGRSGCVHADKVTSATFKNFNSTTRRRWQEVFSFKQHRME